MARGDRLLVAVLLLPPGLWLGLRTLRPARARDPRPPSRRTTRTLALLVGIAGGIYGIGGGSLLGPVLVGRGVPVATVAPAALASTFVTSLVGAGTYALLSLTATDQVARTGSWACPAGPKDSSAQHLQPRLPEVGLRLLLAALATGVGVLYTVQVLSRPGRPGPEPPTRGKPRSLLKGGRVRLRFRWRRRMRRPRIRSRDRK